VQILVKLKLGNKKCKRIINLPPKKRTSIGTIIKIIKNIRTDSDANFSNEILRESERSLKN